ncbi:hypothetical protein [Streptomyces sp. NBC_01497]|uniref:hypothetical protein n=1 Tax=Streptomyces sp. NBC_01497 TaxID=2903885 RepID=UPI002E2EFE69|nr:hypothetical protein [Streptomyces sp. NBC_01497]
MKHIRATAWTGVTVIALAASSACGAGVEKKTADAVNNAHTIMSTLTRASEKASKFGSAEVESTTTVTGGKPITMRGTYSWGDGAAMDVQMDTASAQMQALQDAPTTTMKLVHGAYFYGIDPQQAGPLKGKHWMRIDVSAVAGASGAKAIEADADPTAGLRNIGASKDVKDVGEETIRGRKTTHYRGSVKALSIANVATQGKKSPAQAPKAGSGKTTVDIWVDAKNLPVRVTQRGGGLTNTMDFLRFGTTKKITAPPAADTGDLTDQVTKQREQSLGQ